MNSIIVGVDGSPTAREAARRAAELADRCGVPLHMVTAMPKATSKTVKAGGETWVIDSVSAAEQVLAELKSEIKASHGITTSVATGDPAEAVVKEAERIGASIIVVGNRRVQGAKRILGSVATDITRHATCDVLIAKTT